VASNKVKFVAAVLVAAVLLLGTFAFLTSPQSEMLPQGGSAVDGTHQTENSTFPLADSAGFVTTAGSADRDSLLQRAEDLDMFGAFFQSGSAVSGKFVAFNYDQGAGSITSYRVYNNQSQATVFEAMRVSTLAGANGALNLSMFSASSSSVQLMVHNNPWGTIHLAAANETTVTISLAQGADVMDINHTDVWGTDRAAVNITLPEVAGTLAVIHGSIDISPDQGNLTVNIYKGGQLFFRAYADYTRISHGGQWLTMDYLIRGAISSELWALASNTSAIYDLVQFQPGSLSLTSDKANVSDLEVGVPAHSILFVHLDQGSIGHLDSFIPVGMATATVAGTNIRDDLKAWRDNSTEPVRYVIRNGDVTTAAMYVPAGASAPKLVVGLDHKSSD
jgi:hypothetical protein